MIGKMRRNRAFALQQRDSTGISSKQKKDKAKEAPMPAYLVGHISVKNDDLWQTYVEGVGESLSAFESKIVFRGKLVSVLAGRHAHDTVVVIEFCDHGTLDDWFRSESYQSLIPIRDAAADVTITTYET
jgi:uncharacterized protein (DUF1330 family)